MTGFKSGASADDPFSSDSDEIGENGNKDDEAKTSSASTEMEAQTGLTSDRDTSADGSTETTSIESGLPWIYQRDSITDGRTKTVQLHLQDSTLEHQREARTDVGTILGESVKKANLREAALLVGLEHIDEVADQLRDWGYDFE